MLHFLPAPLLGSLTLLLMFINTVLWNIPLYAVTLLKILFPLRACRRVFDRILIVVAEGWITSNNLILDLTQKIQWQVEGLEGLSKKEWYLILSNHQSWADILILQRVFNRRIPFLKFFLKQELIWVPILGVSWWALDYPFMKRFSREHLAKHPEDKGKDWETTRKKCGHFKDKPTSILNFVEGTRFSAIKKAAKQSPYRYLLPPKAGGLGFTMACMGTLFSSVLDVTIAYPGATPLFWNFVSGRIPKVVVQIRRLPVPGDLLSGNYMEDEALRLKFQDWTRKLWAEKDRQLGRTLTVQTEAIG